ncbi:hypothetical protein SAMN06295910_0562 [Allosphingosinicella indica]|uniref:Uncharacterized protein n=1 Tax=Allosphingosinicella indica TaxID=941907 RepID=A0A1X7FZM2_9SPHN|nr:hypothetical protein SAMN06295910_0562 [Allosphingosinicella indica]
MAGVPLKTLPNLSPSPRWGGVGVGWRLRKSAFISTATATHDQVAMSPGHGFGLRGNPSLIISPIKGEGFEGASSHVLHPGILR